MTGCARTTGVDSHFRGNDGLRTYDWGGFPVMLTKVGIRGNDGGNDGLRTYDDVDSRFRGNDGRGKLFNSCLQIHQDLPQQPICLPLKRFDIGADLGQGA